MLAIVAGCGYAPARFADRPAILAVGDRKPIERPRPRLALRPFDLADGYVRQSVTAALDPSEPELALDVNALDDVVLSSWWQPPTDAASPLSTYRVVGPPASPVAVRDGPVPTDRAGATVIVDARGVRYALLLDPPGRPGLYATSGVVASRLLFALGYRVAEAWPVTLPSGRSGLALGWPLGEDLGPTPPYQGRFDDPNDTVVRKDRRSLRALPRVLSWVGRQGIGVGDLRDGYTGTSPQGHVLHYVMGLEGALGVDALERHLERLRDPDRPAENAGERFVTLGLSPPQRLSLPTTIAPSVGIFDADVDPEAFAASPPFEPLRYVTPADDMWIGERLAQLRLEVIVEAVAAAPVDDRTRAELVERLEVRRRTVAAWTLAKGTPLDPERVVRTADGGFRLMLLDHAIVGELALGEGSSWGVTLYDGNGAPMDERPEVVRTARGAELVVPGAWLRGHDYVVLRILGRRGRLSAPRPMEVHLALGGGSPPRVVGVVH